MEKVIGIMKSVRQWAESNRFNLYHKGYDDELAGMCCIASARLFESLSGAGYKPIICISELDDSAHCYLKLDDIVLDVTSSQFGENNISIIHEKLAEEFWYWRDVYSFNSVKELLKYQKQHRFPKHQLATHDMIRYNSSNIH